MLHNQNQYAEEFNVHMTDICLSYQLLNRRPYPLARLISFKNRVNKTRHQSWRLSLSTRVLHQIPFLIIRKHKNKTSNSSIQFFSKRRRQSIVGARSFVFSFIIQCAEVNKGLALNSWRNCVVLCLHIFLFSSPSRACTAKTFYFHFTFLSVVFHFESARRRRHRC